MSAQHQDALIANGSSTSIEIDITDRVLVAVEVPAAWTAATIAITAAQKSTADGGVYVPVFDAAGTELEITVAASRVVVIAPDASRSLRWIKLRSGPSSARVAQGADRVLDICTIEDTRT